MSSASPAFESYVAARWTRLVRSAVLLGADPHSAEDAVQTTLARCYLKWDQVAHARDVDAYVHRMLINTLKAGWRRRWSGEHPTDSLPERQTSDPMARVDENEALIVALKRLPEAQRRVVVLRFYADFTEAQTAEVLGVAVGTVKSRTARALSALSADTSLNVEMEQR